MPLARSADATCPRCRIGDTWRFEKREATHTKIHFGCDGCGHEWTERRRDGGLDGRQA